MTKVRVGPINQIKKNEGKAFTVNGQSIVVYNADGKLYATLNACTHEDLPMEDGPVDGTTVTCPHHASQFDLRTGKVLSPPATRPLHMFKTSVEGNDLFIEM